MAVFLAPPREFCQRAQLGFFQHVRCEVLRLAPIRKRDVGAIEVDAGHVDIAHMGAAQRGVLEVGVGQIHSAEFGACEVWHR